MNPHDNWCPKHKRWMYLDETRKETTWRCSECDREAKEQAMNPQLIQEIDRGKSDKEASIQELKRRRGVAFAKQKWDRQDEIDAELERRGVRE
jgi:hypothetical protein